MANPCRKSFVQGLLALCAGLGLGPLATAPVLAEPAITHRASDAALAWGPCPPFMPKGCEIAVLHGNPAEPNADVFLRLPGKAVIPNHWHSSAERMVLAQGVLEVTYDGQAPVTLRPGTYAYGPAKAPHQAVCRSATPCVLFIAFEQPVDAHQLP